MDAHVVNYPLESNAELVHSFDTTYSGQAINEGVADVPPLFPLRVRVGQDHYFKIEILSMVDLMAKSVFILSQCFWATGWCGVPEERVVV